jgi:SNF2 family DNA or RNA helicase
MPETVVAEETIKVEEGADNSGSESDFDLDLDDETDDDDDTNANDDADKHGNLRGFIVSDDDSDAEEDNVKGKKPAPPIDSNKRRQKNNRHHRNGNGNRSANSKGKRVVVGPSGSTIKPSELRQIRAAAARNMEAKRRYFSFLSKHWLSSAKVDAAIRLLREIQATGERTIVFSQWTSLLDLLQVAMHKENLGRPCRYDGGMSADARNQSAHRFRDPESRETVMLVSLKAGNAGLNLTSASRVIIMDPFWNPYVEMQAVDRAYRIGQTREVKVYRILVRGTVEDKIVALQEKKRTMVESALDEAGGKAIGRLSVEELKFMFGL